MAAGCLMTWIQTLQGEQLYRPLVLEAQPGEKQLQHLRSCEKSSLSGPSPTRPREQNLHFNKSSR